MIWNSMRPTPGHVAVHWEHVPPQKDPDRPSGWRSVGVPVPEWSRMDSRGHQVTRGCDIHLVSEWASPNSARSLSPPPRSGNVPWPDERKGPKPETGPLGARA